jgi:hypothetical protein
MPVPRVDGEADALQRMRAMLEFLGGTTGLPRDVLDECIQRLNAAANRIPAYGPGVKQMAEKVDAAT